MKIKITILTVLLLAPLWLCILYASLPLGSIGPMVPLTWIVNSALLPLALIYALKEIKNEKHRKLWMIGSVPIGLILAYFQFVSYMPLTAWFDLSDFNWI